MRIAICDDETHILDLLYEKTRAVLAQDNKTADISLFSDPQKLLACYKKDDAPFDLLFLDIRMKGLDGLQLAEKMEYVFRGYEVKAFRYLMKNELDYGFSKVLRDCMAEWENSESDRFTFQFGAETISLDLQDIYYFESKKRIVTIYQSQGSYRTYAKLDDIENTLIDKDFIRCHQSFLVNAKKIAKLSAQEIHLKNGVVIPVSKKYKQSVGEAYLKSISKVWARPTFGL